MLLPDIGQPVHYACSWTNTAEYFRCWTNGRVYVTVEVLKRFVTSTVRPWIHIEDESGPQPMSCSFVFIKEVCRPIVCAASSKLVSISGHVAGQSLNRTASSA